MENEILSLALPGVVGQARDALTRLAAALRLSALRDDETKPSRTQNAPIDLALQTAIAATIKDTLANSWPRSNTPHPPNVLDRRREKGHPGQGPSGTQSSPDHPSTPQRNTH